jgi:hypothetical protein
MHTHTHTQAHTAQGDVEVGEGGRNGRMPTHGGLLAAADRRHSPCVNADVGICPYMQ